MPDPTPETALDSFAAVLAGELPGFWTSTYHPDRDGDHEALTANVWDMNDVADALARHTLDRYAVLTRADGCRLFVADPVGHGEGYLIATMAPDELPDEAFRGVREPDGITVTADPFLAADDVTHVLLPRYDKALSQVHTNAARLAVPPDDDPERVALLVYGEDLVVAKPERTDVSQVLIDHGFTLDSDRHAFVLPGGDFTRQAASVGSAAQRLAELGFGVVVRHPPARSAPRTTPARPPSPRVTAPRPGR